MESVFVFNQPIGKWNTASLTNMDHMFRYNQFFNQDISRWNVEKVTSMESVFVFNNVFDQDLSSWNVEKVTSMDAMFYKATSFTKSFVEEKWDLNGKVVDYMFVDCCTN